MEESKNKEENNWPFKISFTITIVWISIWVCILIYRYGSQLYTPETYKIFSLNEAGDFFAGVFAPLAFFWLVLGYFQQQKELRLNTEAILLQQKEMEQLVGANKDMIKIEEGKAAPHLQLGIVEQKGSRISIGWINGGALVFEARFVGFGDEESKDSWTIEGKFTEDKTFNPTTILKAGSFGTLTFKSKCSSPEEFFKERSGFLFAYKDTTGKIRKINYDWWGNQFGSDYESDLKDGFEIV